MQLVLLLITLSLCQQPSDSARVIAYLHSARHADGGYGLNPATADSSLSATTAAIRALKQWGGTPGEQAKTKAFVWSCFRSETGQFAETPQGDPNYRLTAIGVMAVCDLNERFTPDALARIQARLLSSDKPDEIRLGAAAIEALVRSEHLKKAPIEWKAKLNTVYQKERNADSTYGSGTGQARTTAGYVVSYLRLGYPISHSDGKTVVDFLKTRQLSSGPWLNDKGEADLETTYRVMRCLYSLRCTDAKMVNQCEKFIASCRQADGGYGIGQSSVQGTYFAGEIQHWITELRK